MSKRRKKDRRKDQLRKQLRRRQAQTFAAPGQAVFPVACLLSLAAPAIEAAGSLERAIRAGAVDFPDEWQDLLFDHVPVSRGGRLRGAAAEADWERMVREAVRERNVDLDAMRAHINRLDPPTLPPPGTSSKVWPEES